ncbi:cupin domain-containing protein [Rhizobium bangladeshense]|uniref:cupin domain-containing protein n=1 Tax=Rhizobium bangladeshense TaxID=1138189 RepID=UPI001C83D238|nr:cupin domain-containing protein [Rhizobium bangladeshense]MBX4898764.1 cupin domain-containing protein [Rhizobium bangladeshense]MBY3616939.1 cupin domain-containing protein [Rhizobium bangladeshense]
MRKALVPANTRIVNHFNSETFVFTHPYEGGISSRMDVVLGKGGSGGGNAIAHNHPRTDEIFTVNSGCVMVMIDGKEYVANEGQSITVPKGASHFFRSAFDGDTHLTVTFITAQQHLRFFLNIARWTSEYPDYFKPDGSVKLLPIALALNAFPDHLYISGPPVWLQKALYATLAPIARLMGYRLAVKPASRAEQRAIEDERAFAA